jgi:tRNA A37 threonylcarbamoyltransferase TsaD
MALILLYAIRSGCASGADWGRRMYTLGINAAFHDSSACLVEDGQVVAAVEEERFTRIKHGKRPVPFSTWELPFHAIDYCLREAAIQLTDVANVAYAFDPVLRVRGPLDRATFTLPLQPSAHPVPAEWEAAWDPLFVASMVNAPRHLASGAPHHLAARFKGARADGPYQWHFVEHHVAHAASAFLASPFERAAVLTIDGRGERATTGYFQGCGNQLRSIGEVRMPHSLGILYEQVTEYLGFLHSSDEYKVMALASFGEPAYVDAFRSIVHRGKDGAYTIEPPCLEQRFGPARARGGPLEQRHFDIAHSLQVVLEETVLDLARWLQATTGESDLCLAGGVALNCVMNARVRDEGPFDRVWGATGRRRRRDGPRGRAVDRCQRAWRHRAAVPDGPRLPRPLLSGCRDRVVSHLVEAPLSPVGRHRGRDRRAARHGAHPRLVPGAYGVRPEGARSAIDPGLPHRPRYAGPAQRDQGPGGFPTGGAGGPRRESLGVVRRGRRLPVHAFRPRRPG